MSRSRGRTGLAKPRPSIMVTAVTFVLAIAYLGALGWSFASAGPEVWGGYLLVPVLLAISMPMCRRAAIAANDASVERFLMVALALKFVGALVRYAVAFNVYGGEADANAYDKAGRVLAAGFRAGQLTNFGHGAIKDTHFIEIVTGVLYAIIGNTKLGAFFVYSWMGFLGLYFFYRAFLLAMPHGDRKRYAQLLFFMPSLLFWSSSIGKEAWMTMTIGAVAYGAARALQKQRFAFVFLGLGLWGTEVVRPHMALLILGGLLPAYLLRRRPESETKRKQSLKLLGVAALVVAVVVTLGGVEQRFKVASANSTTATAVLNEAQDQTNTGGSSFQPARVHTPVQFPAAFVTVLFRPFPNEANTTQGIVSALEGAFLMLLMLLSLARLRGLLSEMVRTPYVLFVVIYTCSFVWAFSTISNFGILVRERVQVYPLLFVLLALPIRESAKERRRQSRSRGRSRKRSRRRPSPAPLEPALTRSVS
ncbi:MAG TPA: hypothetical protein VH914_03405 [Acidimicrobiia bacterium]|jgi:hypothetical protein|nr:hypothetical protein [Acidimicrobiia bacterium]